MGGFFAVASKENCVLDLFFGTDYHSHLGTRRAGMAVHGPEGFNRAIHNIQNSPFRTKFERDVEELDGNIGIGCISDFDPQPLLVHSHLGSFAITCVGKINNAEELMQEMLPKVLRMKMFTVLLDSNAAEHAARTMAMQIATDNANELLQELTVMYNKSRQQSITNELLDIVGGSMA